MSENEGKATLEYKIDRMQMQNLLNFLASSDNLLPGPSSLGGKSFAQMESSEITNAPSTTPLFKVRIIICNKYNSRFSGPTPLWIRVKSEQMQKLFDALEIFPISDQTTESDE